MYENDNPLVSVIIPTWNRASFLKKAIQSVLAQTYQNFEILVCDDGSTDNSEEIVKSFNDARIIWVKGERGGRPAFPRNRGIKLAKGEWVAFLDSDDSWLPEKLENQISICMKNNVKACTTNVYFSKNGIVSNEVISLFSKEKITFYDLLKKNSVTCSSTIIHKSIFESVIGFPEEIEFTAVEDYALWLRVAVYTDFSLIQDAFVIYNDAPETSIRNKTSKKDYYRIKRNIFKDFIKWGINQEVSEQLLRKARCKYYRATFTNFLLFPFKRFI